ncbi:SIMPL domain-containing protein [Maribacter algarum]|uniref:SIMPL domain-containing protein n=1 Tax=Maribacter algarum (ex Zhang et al. 2020) TaxID=2578118 RepID=UPI001EE5158E|nr:SIMPL domain-containing protein [Maribacter algarum]
METSATYTTEVTPDNIYLTILITENDTKGKIPVEVLENKMIDKLNTLGIDTKKQLKLLDLTSDFKKSLLRKTDVLKNKEYSLLVHDAVTASKVIKALEQVNISNIRLTKTEYSKLEKLKIELKGKAVAKAKQQAAAMLAPLEQTVGKAIYISDAKTNNLRYLGSNAALNSLNVSNYSDFEVSEIGINKRKVKVEVTVFFEIL